MTAEEKLHNGRISVQQKMADSTDDEGAAVGSSG